MATNKGKGKGGKAAAIASADTVGGGLIQFATRVPIDLHSRLKVACAQAGVKIMPTVISALEACVEAMESATGKRRARA